MKRDDLAIVSLSILAFAVVGVVLQQLQSLLLPFAVAVLLSVLFQPLLAFLRRKGVPTALCLLVVLLVSAAVTLLFGNLLYSASGPLIQDLPRYQVKFNGVLVRVTQSLSALIQKLGIGVEHLDVSTLLGATTVTADVVSSTLRSFVNFLGKASLVLVFMLFMLAGSGTLSGKVKRAFRANEAEHVINALKKIEWQVRRYLVLKVVLSGFSGLVTGLVLWALGVDFALFWGFLAFLLGFIPNLGALVAIGVPFVFSLLQFGSAGRPLLVLALLATIYAIMGSLIEPKVISSSLNLSVLLVLVSLIFWGILWGTWGMVLAIPLTTTIRIVFENVQPLRPIAVLMSVNSDG